MTIKKETGHVHILESEVDFMVKRAWKQQPGYFITTGDAFIYRGPNEVIVTTIRYELVDTDGSDG